MKFDYKLIGIGWVEIGIEVDGMKYFSFPGYLSEPLIDLLEGLLSITPGCVPKDELKSVISFNLYQEPAIDKVTLEVIGDLKLKIVIENFEDESSRNGKIVFNGTCDLLEFLNEVIESLEHLLKKHGFVGYKNTWYRNDFPISSFLKLKYYLNNQLIYPTLIELNDIETELERSDLGEELKLIIGDTKQN